MLLVLVLRGRWRVENLQRHRVRLSQGRWHRRRTVTVVLIDRCCCRRRSLSGVGLKQGHTLREGMRLLLLMLLLHQISSASTSCSAADFESHWRWHRVAAHIVLLLLRNVREVIGKSDVAQVSTRKIHRKRGVILAQPEIEPQADEIRR